MDLARVTQQLAASVKPVDDFFGAGEAILLAGITRAASWGASVPNAVMVARSAQSIYGLSWPWALTIAISLELIGHALVEHWQSAKSWNETKRQTDPAANATLALGLTVGFWVVDFVMVAALAASMWAASGDWRVFVSLCYPLVGVAVAVVTNERAHLFRVKQAVEQERRERKEKRHEGRNRTRNVPGTAAATRAEPYTATSNATRQRAAAILAERPGISGSELGRILGRSPRLGRKLKAELEAAQ